MQETKKKLFLASSIPGFLRAYSLTLLVIKVRLRTWLKHRARNKEARRLLRELFGSGEALRGTSLGPRHAGRWVLLDHEVHGERVSAIRFGILRHPRPHAFSSQSHKVIEVYRYDVATRAVTRLEGHNLTRAKGEDAD